MAADVSADVNADAGDNSNSADATVSPGDVFQDASVCKLGPVDWLWPAAQHEIIADGQESVVSIDGYTAWPITALAQGPTAERTWALLEVDPTGKLVAISTKVNRTLQAGGALGWLATEPGNKVPVSNAALAVDTSGAPLDAYYGPVGAAAREFGYRSGLGIFLYPHDPSQLQSEPAPHAVVGIRPEGTWTVTRPGAIGGNNQCWMYSPLDCPERMVRPVGEHQWLVQDGSTMWGFDDWGKNVVGWQLVGAGTICPTCSYSSVYPIDLGGSLAVVYRPGPPSALSFDFRTYGGAKLGPGTTTPFPIFNAIAGPDHTLSAFHFAGATAPMAPIGTPIRVLVLSATGQIIADIPDVITGKELGEWSPLGHGFLRLSDLVIGLLPPDPFVITDAWHHDSCATSGPCWQKTYTDCTDQNPCTSDLCDAAHNGCYHVPLPDGITCSDAGGQCAGGLCK